MIESWELQRIEEVIEKDIWYLRQLAKRLRGPSAGVERALEEGF